jgi:hypothetical protein
LKKITLITIFLLLVIRPSFANDNIEITLLTCSSGKETFSAWGHTAIRVVDKPAKIDVVYNFGIFNFNTPNFYGKFVKGRLNYQLGIQNTYRFYASYERENRQIIEQKLNLTENEKIKIISRLEYLYQPENRYYLYRFAGKNCTTELRNLILESVSTDFENTLTEKTQRKQLNEFLNGRLWLKFSMSLIMGYKIDEKIDLYQSMFLPDYLCNELRNVKVDNGSIIESEQIYNQIDDPYCNYPFLANPILIFTLLLIIVLASKSKYIKNPVVIITGVTGLAILLVSLITEHPELQYNLNLLWLNPLYLLAVFEFPKRPKLKIYLVKIIQVMITLMIPIWILKVQYFELSYLPLFIVLTIFNLRTLFPDKKLNLI